MNTAKQDEVLNAPDLYDVTQLDLVKTFNHDAIQSNFSEYLLPKSEKTVDSLFRNTDRSSISNALPEQAAFLWHKEDICNLAKVGSKTISVLYIGRGDYEFDAETKEAISNIASEHHVKVVDVHLNFRVVATQGQLYSAIADARITNSWMMIIAANNHDLYKEHSEYLDSLLNAHLLVPLTARKINKELTNDVRSQLNLDAALYSEYAETVAYTRDYAAKTGLKDPTIGLHINKVRQYV